MAFEIDSANLQLIPMLPNNPSLNQLASPRPPAAPAPPPTLAFPIDAAGLQVYAGHQLLPVHPTDLRLAYAPLAASIPGPPARGTVGSVGFFPAMASRRGCNVQLLIVALPLDAALDCAQISPSTAATVSLPKIPMLLVGHKALEFSAVAFAWINHAEA